MDTPKIRSVSAVPPTKLLVEFENGQWRRYDMAPWLEKPAFQGLRNQVLFASVYADRGGYGVIWNDDIDLSEHEIWEHGLPCDPAAPVDSTALQAAEPDCSKVTP